MTVYEYSGRFSRVSDSAQPQPTGRRNRWQHNPSRAVSGDPPPPVGSGISRPSHRIARLGPLPLPHLTSQPTCDISLTTAAEPRQSRRN